MVDIPLRQFGGLIFALCIYLYTSGGSPEETHLRVGHVYTVLLVFLGLAFFLMNGLAIRRGHPIT
jgi:hypothetical protein